MEEKLRRESLPIKNDKININCIKLKGKIGAGESTLFKEIKI
jgi:hypothetical protein